MNVRMKSNKRLEMISAKKYKNILLCSIFIVVFLILDLAIGKTLNYHENFDTQDMHSLMWNDFYKCDQNSIDVMFIGSSHARFAFDTRIFDNELNVKSFNLASSEQTPLIGYYSLKEALKYQKPKLVVYEAYWREFGIVDNTTSAYFVYDYIKGLDTKTKLLVSMYDNKNFSSFLLQALCKTYKYRDNFIPMAKNVLKGKIIKPSPAFKGTQYSNFKYYENGSFGSDMVVSNEKLFKTNPFIKAGLYFKWNETQLEYFKKTIEMCKDNNIKVLIITAPLPQATMNYVKNYDEYSNRIRSITNDYGLEYIDYNIVNKKEGNFKNEFFFDSNHLNSKGTQLLDNILTSVIKENLDMR